LHTARRNLPPSRRNALEFTLVRPSDRVSDRHIVVVRHQLLRRYVQIRKTLPQPTEIVNESLRPKPLSWPRIVIERLRIHHIPQPIQLPANHRLPKLHLRRNVSVLAHDTPPYLRDSSDFCFDEFAEPEDVYFLLPHRPPL